MSGSAVLRRVHLWGKMAREAVRSQRARSDEERALAQSRLADLFVEARGGTMKIGQFLASLPGRDQLDRVVASIEPRPLAEILPVIEAELGPRFRAIAELEEASAAASLGQVHRATLDDGRVVAVKVQYPEIAKAVAAELRLAGLMPGLGPVRRWGFDLGEYKQALADNMDRELDYRTELERQAEFRATVKLEGLVVPDVVPELSSPRVLVQSWEDGVSLHQLRSWPRSERVQVGRVVLATLLKSLFDVGQVHADPNPGNFKFRLGADGKPQVVLLDYGCTVRLSPRERLGLLRLVLGCREGDDTSPLECLVLAGFDRQKLESLGEQIPALCRVLLAPFLEERLFVTRHWALSEQVDSVLGELKWWFRSAAPAPALFLMRAFQGVVGLLETLDVALPWWPIFEQSVSPESRDLARELAVEPPLGSSAAGFRSLAHLLKVRLMEDDQEVVSLAYPALEVLHLPELVPQDVRLRIQENGVDLGALVQEVCSGGVVPGTLFRLEEGKRSLRVWLE